MSKSRIEWLRSDTGEAGFSLNPVKGICPMDCKDNQGKSYCYARRLYKRFKWNPEIRFDQTTFFNLPKKPSRIFVGSTMELFGEWVKREWLETIFTICRQHSEHTFIFLTKRPENLPKEFPENCWVGVSVTNYETFTKGCDRLSQIEAPIKFISFEPLLHFEAKSPLIKERLIDAGVSWVIIGAQTPFSIKTAPKIEWVKEIVEACDKAGIPVFLKNNLSSLWESDTFYPEWAMNKHGFSFRYYLSSLRQEFPNGK